MAAAGRTTTLEIQQAAAAYCRLGPVCSVCVLQCTQLLHTAAATCCSAAGGLLHRTCSCSLARTAPQFRRLETKQSLLDVKVN